jgi:MFS family permease
LPLQEEPSTLPPKESHLEDDAVIRIDRRLWTVAACALCTGVILGVFTAFPIWLPDWRKDFGKTRGEVALIYSGYGVLMILVGPIVGRLLTRIPPWRLIVAGSLVMGCGLILASRLTSYLPFAAVYVAAVGIGGAFAGSLPCQTLGVRLFPRHVGSIGGALMVALAVAGALMPPLLTQTKAVIGWRWALAATGGGVAIFIPLLAVGLMRLPAPSQAGALADAHSHAHASAGPMLRTAGFWILVVGLTPLFGAPTAVHTNMLPILLDRGIGSAQASYLLSIYAIGVTTGAALLGWLADRFGPRPVTLAAAALMAVSLVALVGVGGVVPSGVVLVALGVSAGGIHSLASAFVYRQFRNDFAPAFGLLNLFMLPYMLAPALFGFVRDRSGGYSVVLLAAAAVVVLCATALLWLRQPPALEKVSKERVAIEPDGLAAGV